MRPQGVSFVISLPKSVHLSKCKSKGRQLGDITTNLSNSVMNDDIALSAFCLNGPIITGQR